MRLTQDGGACTGCAPAAAGGRAGGPSDVDARRDRAVRMGWPCCLGMQPAKANEGIHRAWRAMAVRTHRLAAAADHVAARGRRALLARAWQQWRTRGAQRAQARAVWRPIGGLPVLAAPAAAPSFAQRRLWVRRIPPCALTLLPP
jgi:hypothetical protein